MNPFVLERKQSPLRLLLIAVGVMFLLMAGSLIYADQAHAHGWIEDSRSDLCYTGVNVNCGRVQYEPWSIEGRGDFPQVGVPDGQIAGGTVFPELDEQSYNRWEKVNMTGGLHTFHWSIVANHSTNSWDYYITRKGWDPNAPLSRNDLELFCKYEDNSAIPPDHVYHDCFIPNDREGYFVIVGVWDIFDTANAFYQVMDVNLSIDPSQPTTPAPGFPGDPDRFGEIRDWFAIRPYQAGEIVVHNGKLWQARWYTHGQEPGTHEVWLLLGDAPGGGNPGNPGNPPEDPDDPGDPPVSEYPAWSPTVVYTNEIVYHNGQLWQAQWWTLGQEPGTTGPYGPWLPYTP